MSARRWVGFMIVAAIAISAAPRGPGFSTSLVKTVPPSGPAAVATLNPATLDELEAEAAGTATVTLAQALLELGTFHLSRGEQASSVAVLRRAADKLARATTMQPDDRGLRAMTVECDCYLNMALVDSAPAESDVMFERLRASKAAWKLWGNSVGMLDCRIDFHNLPAGHGPRWPGAGRALRPGAAAGCVRGRKKPPAGPEMASTTRRS